MGGRGIKFNETRKTRKVPALPADVKAKLLAGKGDRITSKALGLKADQNKALTKKARGPNKSIDIGKLNISAGNLSKSKILKLEQSLANGITRKNVAPIVVTPTKGKPGQYTVLGKNQNTGNQRIAYLQLAGYKGKVLVKVVSDTRRGLTAKERRTRAAKKAKAAKARK